MAVQLALEKWPGVISTIEIGAEKSIKIGGQNTLPFLFNEGAIPYKPRVAFEIWDILPFDWPDELLKVYGSLLQDPLKWARFLRDECKAELLCVKLQGAHPDNENKSARECADFVSALIKEIGLPLIILGSGDEPKDNQILPACSEAARNQRCLIGSALQDNYKTLVASVLADGHNIIAQSPIDINIAKQLNILISDMGLGFERIVMDPTIGALGYGLEYAYSIMERARLSALQGDKTLACPFICFVGSEAWRTKEARESREQGIIWETITASALLQSGADLLVMRHPEAVRNINNHIEALFK